MGVKRCETYLCLSTAAARGSSSDAREPPPKKVKSSGLASVFAKLAALANNLTPDEAEQEANAVAAPTSVRDQLLGEMARYESLDVSKDTNILQWWKMHQSSFPLLSGKARKYLAVPATSTESERLFSFAGLVISALRTCLTGKHAEMLIFLGKNKEFIPKP